MIFYTVWTPVAAYEATHKIHNPSCFVCDAEPVDFIPIPQGYFIDAVAILRLHQRSNTGGNEYKSMA